MAVNRLQQGFTLLEILVVLALMVMIYALVPPIFSAGGSTTELKASARQVAAGLRKARSVAIVRREDALLTVDVEARRFSLTGDTKTYALPKSSQLSVYTAESEVAADKTGAIRFYPDGSSTGGRITLAQGERKFHVDVDWLSGQVEILDGP